jgi:hypothetical protein
MALGSSAAAVTEACTPPPHNSVSLRRPYTFHAESNFFFALLPTELTTGTSEQALLPWTCETHSCTCTCTRIALILSQQPPCARPASRPFSRTPIPCFPYRVPCPDEMGLDESPLQTSGPSDTQKQMQKYGHLYGFSKADVSGWRRILRDVALCGITVVVCCRCGRLHHLRHLLPYGLQ